MSGGLTGAAAIAALDYLTGRALDLGTAPQTMQLALLSAAPPTNPTISQLSEVTSTGYARQNVSWAAATNPTPGQPSQISNSNNVLYGPFTDVNGLAYPATYCALIGTTLPASTANLLSANASDVETDATAWSAGTNATISQSTAQAKSGTHSLLVTATASGDTQVALASGISVTPFTTYSGAAYCYAPASGVTITLDLRWYDSGSNLISTTSASANAASANSWTQQYTVSGTAPSNAVTAKLYLRPQATAASQNFYFDVMSVVPTQQLSVLMTWQFDTMGQAAQNESLQISTGALSMTLG